MPPNNRPDPAELPDLEIAPILQPLIDEIEQGFHKLPIYGEWILPDIIKQIEEAIERVELDDPQNRSLLALLNDWLGTALIQNPTGNEEDNIERAITCFEFVQGVLSSEDRLQQAEVLSHLAAAYDRRVRGNRAVNQERAIGYYMEALRSIRREDYPLDWASITVNLASLYRQRLVGPRAANQELALMYFQKALEELTPEKNPEAWCTIHLDMGNLYLLRVCDDRAENVERAIDCYENALETLEYSLSGSQYAAIQRCLGRANARRIKGPREENLKLARIYFDTAMRFYSAEQYPAEHRDLQLDCAMLEASRGRWEAAHQAYTVAREMEGHLLHQAAGAAQRDKVLQQGREAATRHGYVLTCLGRIKDAAVEIERGRARGLAETQVLMSMDINSIRDPGRRTRLQEAYQRLLEMQAALYTDTPLAGDEKRKESEERERIGRATADFLWAKSQFDSVVEEIRRANDPANFLVDTFRAANILDVAKQCGQGHALVYLVATPWGGTAVAALASSPQPQGATHFTALDLPGLTNDFVSDLVEVKLDEQTNYTVGGFARAQMGEGYSFLLHQQLWPGASFRTRAETLHEACIMQQKTSMLDVAAQQVLFDAEFRSLADTPSDSLTPEKEKRLSNKLADFFLREEITRSLTALSTVAMVPLVDWLRNQGVTSFTLIPCGALAAFPLGAAFISDTSTIAEALTMSVAPSARSLVYDAYSSSARSGVYALGNPDKSLPCGEKEVRMIAMLGGDETKGQTGQKATLERFIEAAQNALVFHIGSHGQFDIADFLRSKFLLADGEVTLGNLLSHRVDGQNLDLRGMRLLTLAACQTAILDLYGAQDEVRSLAAGMMEAGARAVLGSLWPVSDMATYLLMVRFAQEWFPSMNGEPPAAALARAQHWLRELGVGEVAQYAEQLYRQPQQKHKTELFILKRYYHAQAQQNPTWRPFADPFYWAGFQITGW